MDKEQRGEKIVIRRVYEQPTSIEGAFVVREARHFGDSSSVVELTKENVRKYLPTLEPYIDWENKTFELPLRKMRYTSDEKIGSWPPLIHSAYALEGEGKGDATPSYVVHGLLASGFTGNAHYEKHSYDDGESLAYDVPREELIVEEELVSDGVTEYDRIRLRIKEKNGVWQLEKLVDLYDDERVHIGHEWQVVKDNLQSQEEAKENLESRMTEEVEMVEEKHKVFLEKLASRGGSATALEIYEMKVEREILMHLDRNGCITFTPDTQTQIKRYPAYYSITEKGLSKLDKRG